MISFYTAHKKVRRDFLRVIVGVPEKPLGFLG